MSINSGYSFYQYEGDGVTTQFPLSFSLGELKRAYITCRVNNEVDGTGDPLFRALQDVPGDPGLIEILGGVPAAGVPIVFRRIVPKDLLLHLYANGSILDYPSLDESHLQLMMALHEVLDGYGLTNVFTDINMNGYKLTNVFSDVNDPDSIVTVAFLGTYRQDSINAAIAAADSAVQALAARDAAQAAQAIAVPAAAAAAQSALDAQAAADSVGVLQARGVLLAGQTAITLPWVYNPALKNVAVYLDGVKQDADMALLYTSTTTITLTEAVLEATNWEAISVILAGDSTLSGYVDQAQTIVNNAALSNYPVGALVVATGATPPVGCVVADGSLKSRSAYPDLWAYAQASGNIVADGSWSKGKYSTGDGSTTFRVPNLQDQFIRGASGSRAVGLGEEDAFQGHRMNALNGAAFLNTGIGSSNLVAGTSWVNTGTTGDPVTNGTNGTPRTASETRPKNIAYLMCIKAYDTISDTNILNAAAVVNQIEGKLDKSQNIVLGATVAASGNSVDFVGVPAGVKRITVMFNNVSTTGDSLVIVRIGSNTVETAGYTCQASYIGAAVGTLRSTSGFILMPSHSAALTFGGNLVLTSNGANYTIASVLHRADVDQTMVISGVKTIAGALSRIRITTVNGTDLFDAGNISIAWEF